MTNIIPNGVIKIWLGILAAFLIFCLVILILSKLNPDPCFFPYSVKCYDHQLQICIQEAVYTKDQCVMLRAGKK